MSLQDMAWTDAVRAKRADCHRVGLLAEPWSLAAHPIGGPRMNVQRADTEVQRPEAERVEQEKVEE